MSSAGKLEAATLSLPLKAEYFDAIRNGSKPEEYRLVTPFWAKRIEGRTYERVVLTKGYPSAADEARRFTVPWRGYRRVTLTHPHFGPDPVEVFAIDVSGRFPAGRAALNQSPEEEEAR